MTTYQIFSVSRGELLRSRREGTWTQWHQDADDIRSDIAEKMAQNDPDLRLVNRCSDSDTPEEIARFRSVVM